MTIELALAISIASVSFAIYVGITNMKRNKSTDDKKDASDLTTVIVKLETIGTGVTEIKSDMKNVNEEVRELRDRIIKVEESSKQAHRRLDTCHTRTGTHIDN